MSRSSQKQKNPTSDLVSRRLRGYRPAQGYWKKHTHRLERIRDREQVLRGLVEEAS